MRGCAAGQAAQDAPQEAAVLAGAAALRPGAAVGEPLRAAVARVGVAVARGAAGPRLAALPSVAAWAFRPDQHPWPAPLPAARFARATQRL